MKTRPRTLAALGYLMPALFILLMTIQVLDLHSTLTAGAAQVESNRLINALARWVHPASAVIAVKTCAVVVVVFLAVVWQRSRALDREFAICLSVLLLVYAVGVTNNYLSR